MIFMVRRLREGPHFMIHLSEKIGRVFKRGREHEKRD